MKTKIETLAGLLSATIWADGEYDEAEHTVLGEIADALELDEAKLVSEVEAKLNEIKSANEDEVNAKLKAWGCEVDVEERKVVYEALLQLIISDGVVAYDEIATIFAISEALGMTQEEAVLLLVDMVHTEEDIQVSL